MISKEKNSEEGGIPGEEPKGPFMCPRCHRPVDQYDRNARRNAETRKWEHEDCRTKPRRSTI